MLGCFVSVGLSFDGGTKTTQLTLFFIASLREKKYQFIEQ
jgi:hypothetical protein